MKTTSSAMVIMVSLFLTSIFLAACGNQDQAKQTESKVTAQDVKKEAKEALNTAESYTEQKKDDYMREIESELASFKQKLDKLKAGAMGLTGDAKTEYNQQITLLEQKIKSASEEFNTIKSASGGAWDNMKSGMDKAVDDLKETYDKVVAQYK